MFHLVSINYGQTLSLQNERLTYSATCSLPTKLDENNVILIEVASVPCIQTHNNKIHEYSQKARLTQLASQTFGTSIRLSELRSVTIATASYDIPSFETLKEKRSGTKSACHFSSMEDSVTADANWHTIHSPGWVDSASALLADLQKLDPLSKMLHVSPKYIHQYRCRVFI